MKVVRQHYSDVLSDVQLRAVKKVIGLSGKDARDALLAGQVLKTVRVSRSKALKVMPSIAVEYWKPVAQRFDGVADVETPDSVQTVMLSLAYNRGARNRGLEILKTPLAKGRWLTVTDLVGAMQQDHSLNGIRIRRRMEADLIRQEVEFA